MADIDDSDVGEPETIAAGDATHFQSPKYVTVYANQVQMANTPWDIQMVFSSFQASGNGKVAIEELATIIMSPVHAKVMAKVLITQLRAYEAQFGVIPNLPTNLELKAQAAAEAADASPAAKSAAKSTGETVAPTKKRRPKK